MSTVIGDRPAGQLDAQAVDRLAVDTTGSEVAVALGARMMPAGDGVDARVVPMPSWELDRFGASAPGSEALRNLGITAERVAAVAREAIAAAELGRRSRA